MKPKVAFFSFASCEGCQLQFLNLEDEILSILGAVEVVNFREAVDDRRDDYDIAFIEGSITRECDVEELKEIRGHASVLVAFGACACIGGVNRLKNFQPLEDVRTYVYGDKAGDYDTMPTKAVDEIVEVDAYIRGCPVSKNEILEVVKSLLLGKKPNIPNYPVCVTCKLSENVCLFQKGTFCLGPVTRAGCDPMCPSFGSKCIGCRGMIDNPNVNAEEQVLEEAGLTPDDVIREFRLFHGYVEDRQ